VTISGNLIKVYETTTPLGNEGPITPFTDHERTAIAEYNRRVDGICDCFDALDFTVVPLEGYTHDMQIHAIKEHFKMLHTWYEALDALEGALDPSSTPGDPRHSNAAVRLLRDQADQFFRTLDSTRQEALRYLIGDAGPTPGTGYGLLNLLGNHAGIFA
jgi:hypothetical protein